MKAIGRDNIALAKGNQSALTKAVKKIKKGKGKAKQNEVEVVRGAIIILKHIPHGFYEDEIQSYFRQFGKVLRVRVVRSLKTGKSRGIAYVEFEFDEVAKIAAESMNNYLMFERLIKCEVMPATANRRKIFKNSYVRENKNPKLMARRKRLAEQEHVLSEEEEKDILQQRMDKLEQQNKRFAELGINYHFAIPPPAKKAKIMEPETFIKSPMVEDQTPLNSMEVKVKDKTPKKSLDVQDKTQRKSMEVKAKTPQKSLAIGQKSPKQLSPEGKLKTPNKSTEPAKQKTPTVTPVQKIVQQKTPSGTPKQNKKPKTPSGTPKEDKQKTPGTPKQDKVKQKTPSGTPSLKISKQKTPGTPKLDKVKQKTPSGTPKQDKAKAKTPSGTPNQDKVKAKTPSGTPKQDKIKQKTPSGSPNPELLKQRTPTVSPKLNVVTQKTPSGTPKQDKIKQKTPKKKLMVQPSEEELVGEVEISYIKTASAALKSKKKTPEKPKFSPKQLRSRKSQGAPLTPAPSKKEGKKGKSPEKPKSTNASRKSLATVTINDKKTPEKMPKFSPKLLRSRKSQGPAQAQPQTPVADKPKPEAKKAKTPKVKVSELPKISPKLLRSRKSDAAGLTPMKEKSTPVKAKKAGRKSVF